MNTLHYRDLILLSLFLVISTIQLRAQDFLNEDHVYIESIKTVQFGVPGLEWSMPFVNLSGGQLSLEFDEIANDSRYLRYIIQHCDADWTPSDLEELEYLQGFNGEEIRDFAFSISTRIPYIHYRLQLPNRNIRWTKSGNYMLHIFDEDTGEPMLSRRFVVSEAQVNVGMQLSKPVAVDKITTHHEIDFIVNHKNFRITNPRQEIHALVMQNGRWDSAIDSIEPFLVQPEQLSFDYQNRITFPAGKEFRTCDFRSLRFPSVEVSEIKEYDDAYEVVMKKDEKRTYHNYHTERDLNGQFIVQSYDDTDFDVEAEYAYVMFTLESAQPIYDHDVHVIGAFSDWSPGKSYQLQYDDERGLYFGETLLKQGFYDYLYALTPAGDTTTFETSSLEGNWHETENTYSIIVYYRPFGGRYDRVLATYTQSDR